MHSMIGTWVARHRYRRALGQRIELGNHLVKDMGLSLEEALNEIGKPFWRA